MQPAGCSAGWLVGTQNMGKIYFKLLDFVIDQILELFAVLNKFTALLEQYECI